MTIKEEFEKAFYNPDSTLPAGYYRGGESFDIALWAFHYGLEKAAEVACNYDDASNTMVAKKLRKLAQELSK